MYQSRRLALTIRHPLKDSYYKILDKMKFTLLFLSLKYDGNWQNGMLHGPGNMILPSHVYLGSFFENVVSSLFIFITFTSHKQLLFDPFHLSS